MIGAHSTLKDGKNDLAVLTDSGCIELRLAGLATENLEAHSIYFAGGPVTRRSIENKNSRIILPTNPTLMDKEMGQWRSQHHWPEVGNTKGLEKMSPT